MQNQYPDMLRFTQIGTIVIDLTDFHIFINFLKSDRRLRDFSLWQSRNLFAKTSLCIDVGIRSLIQLLANFAALLEGCSFK